MQLRQNILATLAYYDIFDFPLKATEVVKFLVKFDHLGADYSLKTTHYSLQNIQKDLDQLILERVVGMRDGYYFLFDREYLVPLRKKREKIAKHKWRIAKRAVWWLGHVPYVRVVFASGSMAMENTDELSDLDVLIVVKHGRIWLTRFLITGLLSLLRVLRRGHDKVAPDKICPNHYITDRSLLIPYKSIYTAQTYANLVPIYVRSKDFLEKFMENNEWIREYVRDWILGGNSVNTKHSRSILTRIGELLLDNRIGDWLERKAGNYQSQRIADNPSTNQTGGRVVFNDEQLEFHPHSIETKVILRYNEKLKQLGLSEFAIEKDSGLVH